MGQVVSLVHDLHKRNAKRLARTILETLGNNPMACDLADKLPLYQGVNNWLVIKSIIQLRYPSPHLCHMRDLETLELDLIAQLLTAMRHPAVSHRISR